jgi:2-dehydropantoate 2-reductase
VVLAGTGAEDLARALSATGTPSRAVDDIRVHVWRKLVGNAAVNALTALHRVPNGALLERHDLRADFEATAREAGAVARASGIDLGADPVALAQALVRATAANRSSMLQDAERGAPTEIEALNGAISRTGQTLGVPTPVNDALWRAVRQLHSAGTAGAA